ncbi:MAG: ribosome-associated translation inhibitor RaiA [Bacteroidales bacterium]|nr:ribosome-associated translation inhibitor RaiA [Bacteroidales bacterium]
MKIRLKSTKLEMTDAIANYFQEKMNMLDKYLGDIQVLNCDCEVEKVGGEQKNGKVFRAEVNLEVPGALLRVEKEANDLYKAIDKVKDHMLIVIKKHKETKAS